MEDIKVSVVLPIYNAGKYVKTTIDSLIMQTFKNFEIICVNDGSKDDSLNIIKSYSQKDNRIKIIDKKNEGVWKARLDGIKVANGDFITFIDSDDYVERNFIEEMYNNITKNNSDMAICGFKRVDEKTGKVLSSEMKYNEGKTILEGENFEEVISINTALWNKIFKASILKKIDDLENPPRILEDMMFLALTYLKEKKISFVNKYLYNYIVRDGSAMNTLKIGEIENIQNAMINIKKIYIKDNANNEKMEILSSMAFLHFGISLMFRVLNDSESDFDEKYKDNLKFLNNEFPRWKTTKFLRINYSLKHKKANIKVAIVRLVYKMHIFKIFINTYKFITKTFKFDIKW